MDSNTIPLKFLNEDQLSKLGWIAVKKSLPPKVGEVLHGEPPCTSDYVEILLPDRTTWEAYYHYGNKSTEKSWRGNGNLPQDRRNVYYPTHWRLKEQ